MSKSKDKGTAWETACVRRFSESLGEPLERRALAGVFDKGDFRLALPCGPVGIAECKTYKSYGMALVTEWRGQTKAERENSGDEFGALLIHRSGAGSRWPSPTFDLNRTDVTLRDLGRICAASGADPDEVWVSLNVGEFLRACGGAA